MESLKQDNTDFGAHIKFLTSERDQFREELRNLLELKGKMEKEKAVSMEAFKRRTTELERVSNATRLECETLFEEKQ